jgi:hypothetical protein
MTVETLLYPALMAGKKSTDATQNLPPDHPTQVGPGGTKLGLPKRSEVEDMLRRLSGKKKSS